MSWAWEEERRAGILEGVLSSLKSIMKNFKCSLEDAMDALELSEEDKDICRKKIELDY